ncbi:membrane protein A25A [Aotine betaherpesvirus 1]|uniref:Membrane protein A25A n=1 Tax=Aotine betaherpesvirus 1 TaxID=50290 RepID=G8XUJ3_9BETA|nr:membrane protein A25A [Aotine betaherpesvirus 1]AEV80833.1 membrane protein A25A [Aotine betaherpesvirus 1]
MAGWWVCMVVMAFSSRSAALPDISNICAFTANSSKMEIPFAVTTSLTCLFPYTVNSVFGIQLAPWIGSAVRRSLLYRVFSRDGIVPVTQSWPLHPSLAIEVTQNATTILMTVRFPSSSVMGNALYCTFYNLPWEAISIEVKIAKHHMDGRFLCAEHAYSRFGVSSVEPMRPESQPWSWETCHDGNETTRVKTLRLFTSCCKLCSMIPALCLDSAGNIWQPEAGHVHGRPPACVANRSIVPYPLPTTHTVPVIPQTTSSPNVITVIQINPRRDLYTKISGMLSLFGSSVTVFLLIILRNIIEKVTICHATTLIPCYVVTFR